MKTVAICTTLPTKRKNRRAIRQPLPTPGIVNGNQWVAEIEGDTVPVGEHNSPEAALLAARYLAAMMTM